MWEESRSFWISPLETSHSSLAPSAPPGLHTRCQSFVHETVGEALAVITRLVSTAANTSERAESAQMIPILGFSCFAFWLWDILVTFWDSGRLCHVPGTQQADEH